MSHKVSLPDGEWASLRDPEDVPERLRRPAYRAMMSSLQLLRKMPRTQDDDDTAVADVDEATLLALSESADVIMFALLESWSYEFPVSVASILDLPGKAYDALQAECKGLSARMFIDFSVNGAIDPKADTGA